MSYLSLLRLHLPDISPEAKFLLLRFLQKYGEGRSVRQGVATFAADLGVSGPMAKRGLHELTAVGFLSQCENRSEYECSQTLRETLASESVKRVTSSLYQLADRVLNPATELISLKSYDRRESGMSLDSVTPAERKEAARKMLREAASGTNRLLLAVLLIHADEFGVVRGLGISDLCTLTGLKRERLEMHLFKLNELGAIRFKIAGFSGSRILGSLKTIYYLNLHHRCFYNSNSTLMVFVLKAKSDYRNNVDLLAEKIFLTEEGACGFYWPLTAVDPLGPVKLFDDIVVSSLLNSKLAGGGRAELLMLRAIVDQHVSSLLSMHWNKLCAKELFTDLGLLETIKSQVKLPWLKSVAIDALSGRSAEEVVYNMVFYLACQYKVLLGSAGDHVSEGMKFHILPFSDQCRGRRAVLALRKDGALDRRCLVITEAESEIQSYECEAVMTVDQRFEYGLFGEFHALKRYGRSVTRYMPVFRQ
ncbi:MULTISPECIES: hypothetical protein [Pseudomonadaceae]|nr:hypothetical protein [Pseudomonas aeruginosa]EJY6040337.1 hypothetical protein [Pseudomonas aeruginosa]EKN9356862.1 hypothetical protein [Pseudomonas aeruginosa]EKW2827194.1 hypothetical protein [Pseudomonas aeruginosa]ELQ8277454.1 hypothetical protein [Pseudomonas aeruginosa]MCV0054991.1 hypothetical protein [Pseudomonas aeruginosa]